jgi:hypothetical protein
MVRLLLFAEHLLFAACLRKMVHILLDQMGISGRSLHL